MNEFAHLRILIGIILGLSITHLLKGAAKFIQHPGRIRPYWVHLGWTLYLFLLLVHFWWWEFKLNEVTHWNFTYYAFIICFIVSFFVLCALLYPEDMSDYPDYETYYYSRKKWFFAVLALSFVLDIGDTLIKGEAWMRHYGIEYPIRNAVHIVLCLVAMKVNNKTFHAALVVLFILYELSYILRLFYSV